eukprot:TRINITY_DN10029_c0_g2_i1.p1 TRINITY_DN10029_c0_g2~~TRINITY_DN10029_c0_g2_i1.p1  ORF type:complete len:226 (+),score=-7.38 TRINITY_DN10029_c0_g2_i1:229-906(+)
MRKQITLFLIVLLFLFVDLEEVESLVKKEKLLNTIIQVMKNYPASILVLHSGCCFISNFLTSLDADDPKRQLSIEILEKIISIVSQNFMFFMESEKNDQVDSDFITKPLDTLLILWDNFDELRGTLMKQGLESIICNVIHNFPLAIGSASQFIKKISLDYKVNIRAIVTKLVAAGIVPKLVKRLVEDDTNFYIICRAFAKSICRKHVDRVANCCACAGSTSPTPT